MRQVFYIFSLRTERERQREEKIKFFVSLYYIIYLSTMNVHNVNTLFCAVFTKTDKLRVNYVKKERKGRRAVNYYRGGRETKRMMLK